MPGEKDQSQTLDVWPFSTTSMYGKDGHHGVSGSDRVRSTFLFGGVSHLATSTIAGPLIVGKKLQLSSAPQLQEAPN